MVEDVSRRFGVLKVYERNGERFTAVPLASNVYTIGSSEKATIKVCRQDVDPIHCEVSICKETRLARLINRSTKNPVPINGNPAPKEMFLLPNDTFTVVGKRFVYENDKLDPKVIREAKARNLENMKKMKRMTTGRPLLTPQPESGIRLKPRRSSSLDNQCPQTPAQKARQLFMGRSSSSMEFPTKSSGSRNFNGFAVSTPESAVKPSLRNATIFKNLATMSYSEPECDDSNSSSSTAQQEQRGELIKTPVGEFDADGAEVISTPLNNTSSITIPSPLLEEDESPLRSQKSKAKDISIQRLTNNDDSINVLETAGDKTPKSALKSNTTKTPIGSMIKVKLLNDYMDSDEDWSKSGTTEADLGEEAPKETDVIEIVDSSMDSSDLDEGNISPSSKSSDLKPSRKSEGFIMHKLVRDCRPTETDSANGFEVEIATPDSKKIDLVTETDSCGKDFGMKTPLCSTPAPKKSAKKLEKSFKDIDEGDDEVSETSNSQQTTATDSSDCGIQTAQKRKRWDMSTDTSSVNVDCKRVKYVDSESTLAEMCSFSSHDCSITDQSREGEADEVPTPAPSIPGRKCVTEPRQAKRVALTRRSLSDRISNQENEPMEASNTTLESVETSSFVYVKNNVAFEISEFESSGVSVQAEESKKTPKKTPLNDLTDVDGVKKLMQTPPVSKEPLNDLSSLTGVKQLMKTPKCVKNAGDTDANLSGVKALLKTPTVPKHCDELSSEEANVNVLNVSGVASLQGDEEDIFPIKKVTRTYGRSLPANSKSHTPKSSRRTEGFSIEVSPDVKEWVEKSNLYLSDGDNDVEEAPDEQFLNAGEEIDDVDAVQEVVEVLDDSHKEDEDVDDSQEELGVLEVESLDDTHEEFENLDDTHEEVENIDDTHEEVENVDDTHEEIENQNDTHEDVEDLDGPCEEVKDVDGALEEVQDMDDTHEDVDDTHDIEYTDAVEYEEVPEVSSSRKSIRKSLKTTETETFDDTDDIVHEEVNMDDENVVDKTPAKLVGKSEVSRKSSRKSMTVVVIEPEETETICQVVVEGTELSLKDKEEVGSRKSTRKSIKPVLSEIESTETTETTKIDDKVDKSFPKLVSKSELSRKSSRKSMKAVVIEPEETGTICQVAVEGTELSLKDKEEVGSRKSTRKSIKPMLSEIESTETTETTEIDDEVDKPFPKLASKSELSRKSSRKSMKAVVIEPEETEAICQVDEEGTEFSLKDNEEVGSRKSTRKSVKPMFSEIESTETTEMDDEVDDKSSAKLVRKSEVSRKSLRKSMKTAVLESEEVSVTIDQTVDDGNELLLEDTEEIGSRKSIRKSVEVTPTETEPVENLETGEDTAGSEEVLLFVEEVETVEILEESLIEENDQPGIDEEDKQEVKEKDDQQEIEETYQQEVEVVSRKSSRKSIKIVDQVKQIVPEKELEEQMKTEESPEVSQPVARKSSRKNAKNYLVQGESLDDIVKEIIIETEVVSRKSVRESTIALSTEICEATETDEIPEIPEADTSKAQKSTTKTLNEDKISKEDEDQEETEKMEYNDEQEACEETDQMNQTEDDPESHDDDEKIAVLNESEDEKAVYKNSIRKSVTQTPSTDESKGNNEETVTSSEKSLRKSLRKLSRRQTEDESVTYEQDTPKGIDNEQDKTVSSTVGKRTRKSLIADEISEHDNTPQISGRKSVRRSLAKSVIDSEEPTSTPRSQRKSSSIVLGSDETPQSTSKRTSRGHETTPLSSAKVEDSAAFATPALPRRGARLQKMEKEVSVVLNRISKGSVEEYKSQENNVKSKPDEVEESVAEESVVQTKIRTRRVKKIEQPEESEEAIISTASTVQGSRGRRQKAGQVEDSVVVAKTQDAIEKSAVITKKTRVRRGKKDEPVVEPEGGTTSEASIKKPVEESKNTTRGRRGKKIEEVLPPTEAGVNVLLPVEVKKTTRGRRGQKVEVPEPDISKSEGPVENTAVEVMKKTRGRRSQKVEEAMAPGGSKSGHSAEGTVETKKSRTRPSKSDSTDNTTVPPRRGKRGATPTVNEPEVPEVGSAKQTRGRSGTIDTQEDTPVVKKTTRSRRVKSQDDVTTTVVHEKSVEKPQRLGNKRKGVVETPSSEITEVPPKRTRGKKALPEEPEEPKKEPVAKKSTRARKAKVAESPDIPQVVQPVADEITVEDKKSSRPRGKKAEQTTEKSTDEEQPPRRGRRGAAQKEEEENIASKSSRSKRGKVETPVVPDVEPTKRSRRGQVEKTPEPEDESSGSKRGRSNRTKAKGLQSAEITEVNTRTKEVKGMSVTSVSVKKKVAFVEVNPNALAVTPAPPPTKRRLRSEEEMNTSDLDLPKRKMTRSRK